MPELPEVETLKLGLKKYIVGLKVINVDVKDRKLLTGDEKNVVGATFINVRRYGKGLVMGLDNGYSIAVHIKLTGQLIFRDEKTKDLPVMKPIVMTVPNKFTRVVFKLKAQNEKRKIARQSSKKDSGQARMTGFSYLYFQEVRRFAWMKILRTDEVMNLPFFKSLGPEPFPSPGTETQKLTEDLFEQIIAKSNLPIKALLMDQTKIGGIGNIYTNDSLWNAKIDPRRRAKTLREEEIRMLYQSILKVLRTGLKYKGSSELNFVDVLGNTGKYQHHALVYGKKGKECKRGDGGIIQRIYLGGR